MENRRSGVKDKLKKILDHIWYVFMIYILLMSSTIAVAVGIALPKLGIAVLVLSVGLYGLYLKYAKEKED